LVPILDTNGDGALSREELAVFELLFTGHSSMTSASGAYQSAVSGTDNSSDLLNNVSLKA
jgi:hypothetical protein